MAKRRELWANLVAPQFGGPVFPVSVSVDVSGGTDNFVIFVAPRDCKVRRAKVAHNTAPGGTSTYALRNVTDSVDVSSADIDADALAVDTAGSFTIATANEDLDEGDVLALEATIGSGGGQATVTFEVEFLELKND
jgi:hypothetical protein|tara:strand:+ start:10852 stop:11259 length:408 start_codon:yes stop_codon:yes gene_type:complete